MPYGRRSYPRKRTDGSKRDYTSRRVTATQKIQRAARARLVAKARKMPKRQVAKNALAIRKLREYRWGPLQSNLMYNNNPLYPMKDHPCYFHLNNCYGDMHKNIIYRVDGQTAHAQSNWAEKDHSSVLYGGLADWDIPNGPWMKFVGAQLKFNVQCLSANRHVTVHVIRQKKLASSFYLQQSAMNYMPNTAFRFKDLAGFTANSIDKRYFEVVAMKKLFFNSKGETSAADTAQGHQYTNFPTTRGERTFTMNLRINSAQKQLHASMNQDTGDDDLDINVTTHHPNVGGDPQGSWTYDNIHPLKNYWVIISSDDPQNYGSIVTGDATRVDIIRRNFWRDTRA